MMIDKHNYVDNDDNEEDDQTGNVARTMLAHGTNPSSGIQDNGKLPTRALVNLKDKKLPMATSIFYANHVLPSRPPDTSIEL
jgi:hypothetical protein